MAEDAANLIAETSAALSGLRLGPTPSVRLSKFCGHPQKVGDLIVNEWLDEVEVYSRQMGLVDEARVNALVDYLGGAAKKEVLCASETTRASFSELTNLLRKRFGPAESMHSLSRALNDRVGQEGESLADYSRSLMRLYSRLEKSVQTVEDQQALARLRNVSLKGQFRKGAGNEAVTRDIERIEIGGPGKSFNDLREEVLRLYQDSAHKWSSAQVRHTEVKG